MGLGIEERYDEFYNEVLYFIWQISKLVSITLFKKRRRGNETQNKEKGFGNKANGNTFDRHDAFDFTGDFCTGCGCQF